MDIQKIKNTASLNTNKKAYIYTLTSTLFIFLLIFIFYKINPFGEYTLCTNDGVAQYIPFMNELYDKLKNGETLLYSYNGGLGYNFFGTIAYYMLSPFSFLILLFKKENIVIAVNLIIVLKMCCVSLGMTYYLLHRFKNKNYIYSVIFSLAYTFSYFFLGYSYNFMWLDSIIMLPFILRGLETISTRKGKIQYILSLSYCMLANFYIALIICLFLILYYLCIINFKNVKDFIKKGFSFATCSILSALIASITLIPMGINILSGSSSRTTFPAFSFFNDALYVFERHLPFIQIKTLSQNSGDANLFCTIGIMFLAGLFLFNKTIPPRRKLGTVLLSSFLLFSFTNSWTNFMMHGFYSQRQIPNRFAFLYVFLLVVMAYEVAISLKGLNKKSTIVTSIISIGILAITILSVDPNSPNMNEHLLIILGIYGLAFIITYLSAILSKKEPVKTISIFLVIEILLGLTQIQYASLSDSYDKQINYESAKANEETNEFYREEILNWSVTNASTMYNMQGMTTFNSIINGKTSALLGQLGFDNGENYYTCYGHSPITDSMLSMKYLYSKYSENLPFNFEYVETINDINVYKNNYILPIGYSIDTSSFENNYANKFENLNNLTINYGTLYRGIPIKTSYSSENAEIKKEDNSNYKVTAKKGDTFTFTLEPVEDKNVYIYTKCYGESNITIKVNERIIASFSHTGYISYLGDLTKEDVITISYTARRDINNKSSTIFLSSLNQSVFEDFYYDTLSNSMQNVTFNKNTISGKFTATKDNTQIMFSIPYDKGWKVFVDGNLTNLENIKNAFCAVTVNEGTHDIKLVYAPNGLEIGAVCSGLGLLIFVAYIVITKYRKNSETNSYKAKNI